MAVLRPLKVIIDNYPEGKVEEMQAENNPENPETGTRMMPFSREIYIEQEDFMENPPKKFFRLAPGQEVRLKHAYIIKCANVVKDKKTGEVIELHCTYDPQTRSGSDTSGRKVKGTLHWVSAQQALKAEVRLYDYLFMNMAEGEEDNREMVLNPNSLEQLTACMVEPSLKNAKPGDRFQFLRQGYFCADQDSSEEKLVFNRIVSLRDSWAKKA
jgi:glutaminyl-tRNA synthetase